MSEKHTDRAVRAAKGIWKDGKITLHDDTDYNAFIESATTIIDQETGLPEITAERDRLWESNEKLLDILQSAISSGPMRIHPTPETFTSVELLPDITLVDFRMSVYTYKKIKAALVKAEPETKDDDS